MRNRQRAGWLAVMLVLAGCATDRPPPGSSSPALPAQVVPDSRPQGRVVSVNSRGQFVIIDFNVGAVPHLPASMNIYRGNEIVGAINLAGPANGHLVAGDIVRGEAAAGDVAILDGSAGPAGAGSP